MAATLLPHIAPIMIAMAAFATAIGGVFAWIVARVWQRITLLEGKVEAAEKKAKEADAKFHECEQRELANRAEIFRLETALRLVSAALQKIDPKSDIIKLVAELIGKRDLLATPTDALLAKLAEHVEQVLDERTLAP